jgi:ABC-type transport system involved in cytochrome c biogenesis permease component
MKEKLKQLIDRRTVICFIALIMLFILALRGEERVAIEAISGIIWTAIALSSVNGAEKSLRYFGRGSTPSLKEPKAKVPKAPREGA